GLAPYPPELRPCVAALGVFDGIHLAHSRLIETAVERARALRVPSVVCTFHPDPASVLRPERAPVPIAPLEDNLERMAGIGGDAARAAELLGHPYAIAGVIARGAGRGRTLGFPTANVRPDRPLALAAGVYIARATWDGGAANAVVNVGYRPTFGENEYWVEAYLLDFSGDLYDRTLRVEFLERIRPEMKFSGVDALKRQVMTDIATARSRLGGTRAQP